MGLEIYGCLWVFGCKSKAICPMNNRYCEGVVTVDLSTCVSMGVYGCLQVYGCLWVYGLWVSKGVYGCLWVCGCKSMVTCPMKNRHCKGVITVGLSSCASMGVYGCHGSLQVYGCLWVYIQVSMVVSLSLSLSLCFSCSLNYIVFYSGL